MKTRCPISTISYNTKSFLLHTLNSLVENKKIDEWFCIYHHAEDDEKSDHWHIYLEPSGEIDCTELKKSFVEIDPLHPSLPLQCIKFKKSQIDHAILYFMHYKPYLAWKHQTRKYHYLFSDIYTSDALWLDDVYYNALHFSEFAEKNEILKAIQEHQDDLAGLITAGVVPFNQATQLNAYSHLLYNQDETYRNSRKTHSPK